MVRQIKVLEIQPSEEATRASDQVQLQSSDHVNKTEPEVAVFETTPETEVEAAVEATALEEPSPKPTVFSAHETKTKVIQQVTCQDCGKSMSAKNLRYSHAKSCTARNAETPPVVETPSPPEVENPRTPGIETPKEPTPKCTRAKAKAQPQQDQQEPTHAADKVPPQAPPPSSRPPKQKHETPDQFWTNTLKQMKERKSLQYQKLAAAAFYIYIYIYICIFMFD
jgi:hypothetical protein